MWRPIESQAQRDRVLEIVRDVADKLRDPQKIRDCGGELEKTAAEWGGSFRWDDAVLGDGFPGLCLLFGVLDRQFPDESWDLVGHELLVEVQKALASEQLRPLALFSGFAGVGMGVLALSRGGTRYSQFSEQLNRLLLQRCQEVLDIVRSHLATGVGLFDYDVIFGVTGIGRYLLFHRDQPDLQQALSDVLSYLVLLSEDKWVAGQRVPGWYIAFEQQKQEADRLLFPQGHFNLGMAHGIPGPMALMSLALEQGVEVPGQRAAIRKMADWLLRWQQVDAFGPWWPGRLSWEEHAEHEVRNGTRAAWCYGTPGVARAIWLAGRALQEEAWQAQAIKAYVALFQRPEQSWRISSPNICHGYAGLLMLTQRMYAESSVSELEPYRDGLLQRLLDMHEEDAPFGYHDLVLDGDVLLKRSIPGLLEGAAGTALVLLSLIGEQEPEWDAVLMSV